MRISDWSSDVCSSDLSSGLNIYSDPYEQVDLNASYDLFDNLQLTASVINLTKSEQRQHLGNDTKDRIISNVYRSEEHTSELQSLMRISYAVFCLKKKTA